MTSFTTRLISGSVYVALIVGALLLPTVWGLWALLSFFAVAGIIEFNQLTKVNRPHIFRIALDCVAAVWLLYAMIQHMMSVGRISVFAPYILYLFYIVVRSPFLPHKDMLKSLGNSIIGQLYIAVPLALALRLTLEYGRPFVETVHYNGLLLLLVFIFIWINDTGAYLIGTRWGKTPLAPSISPKKTVEGFIGGLLLVLLSSVVLRWSIFPELSWGESLMIGFVSALFGTIGDLFESSLKREAGVKDSGNLIPGHGGILDRIDSLLFAVPAVFLLQSLSLF